MCKSLILQANDVSSVVLIVRKILRSCKSLHVYEYVHELKEKKRKVKIDFIVTILKWL